MVTLTQGTTARGQAPMKAKGRILAALVGILLLAVLGVTIPIQAYRQVVDAADARRHSNEVVRRANDLLSELKDAETGERGYALTGDPAFLEPYNNALARIDSDLATLLRITTNSSARDHLERLAPLIGLRMKELVSMIRVVDSGDRAAARAYIGGGVGKHLMDAVRVEMAAFIQIKETELAAQEAVFQSQMGVLFLVIAVGSVLTLLFAVLLIYLVYRGAQNRLKKAIYLETSRLLDVQRETSSQLQRANVSLQASEERLAVIVRSIGDGLLATDAMGRIEFLNPVAEQLTGWTQAEAAGIPVDEVFKIINHETRIPCVVPVAATLEHGTIQGLGNHTVLIARDGSERPIADSCAPMRDLDHRVTGAVLVFRDVTNEYAAQLALQESNEKLQGAKLAAEKANLAKSDFLSSMSHELRSPLNAILGFAQLMESSTPLPSQAQAGRINQILQAGWHLLNLINEILDLAVIESGKVSLSLEPVSVPEILSECREMVESQAQKRGIVM
ncbi:MAG: CHASE3 domain-containing protein, partial [Isosphaeraceae bacterium]